MPLPNSAATRVAANVILDGRLALYHEQQRWLAVADLHFGYEISQRVAGRMMPLWGMNSIEERLAELIRDYAPSRLIIAGDLVHDKAATGEAAMLMGRLQALCEVIVLSGNHDRQLAGKISMQPTWQTDRFLFHHGHCETDAGGLTQIIGHHHPAGTIRDGAGLRLKLPAFVQQGNCWILPAFSPWAAGAAWEADAESRVWLCTPTRILRLPDVVATAAV